MKLALLCARGLTKAVSLEVEQRFGKKTSMGEAKQLIIEVADVKEAAEVCYFMQTTYKIFVVLSSGKISDFSLGEAQQWVGTTFSVRSNVQEKEEEIGEQIEGKVDLTHPTTPFYCFIDGEEYLFGVDLTGFDTSKRCYKLYQHNDQLKGSTAAALLYLARYSKETVLLDPFCGSGLIAIEAAHIGRGRSVNYYNKEKFAFRNIPQFCDVDVDNLLEEFDKREADGGKIYCFADQQKMVRNAEKNAKIAGVNKCIDYSRQDVEWLDTKCKEGEVDLLVTKPVEPGRLLTDKKVRKVYEDLFYSSSQILSSSEKIFVLLRKVDLFQEVAEAKGYTVSSVPFAQGRETFHFVTLKKN